MALSVVLGMNSDTCAIFGADSKGLVSFRSGPTNWVSQCSVKVVFNVAQLAAVFPVISQVGNPPANNSPMTAVGYVGDSVTAKGFSIVVASNGQGIAPATSFKFNYFVPGGSQ
jgi:hypothetical protein